MKEEREKKSVVRSEICFFGCRRCCLSSDLPPKSVVCFDPIRASLLLLKVEEEEEENPWIRTCGQFDSLQQNATMLFNNNGVHRSLVSFLFPFIYTENPRGFSLFSLHFSHQILLFHEAYSERFFSDYLFIYCTKFSFFSHPLLHQIIFWAKLSFSCLWRNSFRLKSFVFYGKCYDFVCRISPVKDFSVK